MAAPRGKMVLRDLRNGLLFISPWIAGFLAFTIYPILASLYYSFNNYSILIPAEWVGLGNYKALFFEDPLFWVSLTNTLYYIAFALPLGIIIGVTLALFLNMKVKGMAIYRTIYYLPTIVPTIASAILWLWILNPQYGLLNSFLAKIGIQGPGWLASPEWSKPALIIMSWWGLGGAVLIYLAGLQDVPQQLYEAAELDGANWLQKTIHITIPMLTPVIFFNLVMGLIGTFQYFTEAYVMTNGGPVNSTLFYALYLYRNAFVYLKMGYASSMAWLLFILVLTCTLLVFRTSARWVYYGGKA
jgi:multiple sugar transport system permease protein